MRVSVFTLPALRWALGFSAVVGLTLCALPLAGTLGPESALALALGLTPWASALGAALAVRARTTPQRTGPLLVHAVGAAWLVLAVPVALLALNALRVKTCEPFRSLSFIALGPWAGVTLSAVVGVCIGSALPRPRLAITLAALFPLVSLGRSVYDFLQTPGIYAFGHFFGYFPGTFYDRRIDVPNAWLTHRVLSALIGLGLWAMLTAARNARTGHVSFARATRHPVLCGMVVLAGVAALWTARDGYDLGHHTSSAHIANKLGLVIQGKRCRVVLPRELAVGQAMRLTEDCDFRVHQLERTLGVREPDVVTAYFFRSPQEKRTLMGAMRVYIAKPWRREVYLQLGDFPHPVLSHELAHVVARNTSSGMFGVPGRLGGLIPEPTLVEGMAVALEPVPRDALTPHEWAKAAYEAGLAPSLSALLGPRFFGQNQHLAYTLAGSFLRFVLDTRGADALRAVYREGDPERALSKPFAELEREWKAFLAEVPLPAPAAALAKQRFERGGVFSEVCPHTIDRLSGELSAALAAGDLQRAIRRCEDILAVDPKNTGTRATLAGSLARVGKTQEAQAQLDTLKDELSAPRPTLARARAELADAAFMRGDYAAAESAYRKLLDEPQSEGELRELEVKLLALEAGDPVRRLVGELLIGPVGRSRDPRVAMHLIDELTPHRQDGLAQYLAARQLMQAQRHDLALPLIRAAVVRGLPTHRLRTENLRMHGLSAFIGGLLDESAAAYRELELQPGAQLGEQLEARDFLTRIAYRRTGKLP